MIDRCQNCGCAIDDDINAAVEIANEDLQGEIVSQREQIEALTAQVGVLREAAQMAVEMIETNAYERRHVRWKLNDAIATTPESVLSEVRKAEREKCALAVTRAWHKEPYYLLDLTDAIRAMGDE